MTRANLKIFLNDLQAKTPVVTDETAIKPKDVALIMRISESLVDLLDYQSEDAPYRERSDVYGFTAFSARIQKNGSNPAAEWAMAEYNNLSIKRRNAVNKSIMGAILLQNASSLAHLESYVALVGFDEAEVKEVTSKTVWSIERNCFIASGAASILQHTAALYAYTVLASVGDDPTKQSSADYKRAVLLLATLGAIDGDGEPLHFAFNRGWAYAKSIAEVKQARPRGRISPPAMRDNMVVDFIRLKK